MHRLAKDYEKPEFEIRSIQVGGVEVAVQEQVAIEKPFCRLIRFKRFTDDLPTLQRLKHQPTVLVVAPLSGHHSTLLRDTVKSLLQGHKVYLTDWTDARMVPADKGPFHLDDYVAYVQEFIRTIGPEVHVISVCQPTVPVLAAISLMASAGEPTPRTMTMMGGPIDARKSPTSVNNLATNKSYAWFENNVIHRVPPNYPGAGRRVYPGFLQHAGFVAMNPDRHLTSHYDYFLDLVRGDGDKSDVHKDSTTSTTPCSTCPPSTTSTPSRPCSRTSRSSTAPGTSTASWFGRRTSRPPRCSPSKASSTTSPAPARPRPRTTCAPACRRRDASTTTPWAPATTASSRADAGARRSIRRCATSSRHTRRRSASQPPRRPGAARSAPSDAMSSGALADALLDALPQTQCTRCGYDDCRAYAEAIAGGEAAINRCPPGGREGVERLARISGRPVAPLDPACGSEGPRARALIDEAACIGCALCLKACPVDAIVGAAKHMHTVIDDLCTGCELCLPVCPVDCIALVDASGDAPAGTRGARRRRRPRASATRSTRRAGATRSRHSRPAKTWRHRWPNRRRSPQRSRALAPHVRAADP